MKRKIIGDENPPIGPELGGRGGAKIHTLEKHCRVKIPVILEQTNENVLLLQKITH